MGDASRNLYYSDYLKLASILTAQQPESAKYGSPAHDETLFIITHQTYELWFKQILHELQSILEFFSSIPLTSKQLGVVTYRLARIVAIQKVINQQVGILETMTPLDFLDFRDYLTPASGFQSVQFREIELRLGLGYHIKPSFLGRFCERDRVYLEAIAAETSLFERVDAWLARMPFLKFENFDFWETYRIAVQNMLTADRRTIEANASLNQNEKCQQLAELEGTRQNFACLFDDQAYEKAMADRQFQLQQKAILSALFINLYRDEPILRTAFEFLNRLIDVDEQLAAWRNSHALMAQRMLGTKIGTGGSSGHEYLKSTIAKNRIFADLFNLSTFLIPRSALPVLPQDLRQHLGFYFSGDETAQ